MIIMVNQTQGAVLLLHEKERREMKKNVAEKRAHHSHLWPQRGN